MVAEVDRLRNIKRNASLISASIMTVIVVVFAFVAYNYLMNAPETPEFTFDVPILIFVMLIILFVLPRFVHKAVLRLGK